VRALGLGDVAAGVCAAGGGPTGGVTGGI